MLSISQKNTRQVQVSIMTSILGQDSISLKPVTSLNWQYYFTASICMRSSLRCEPITRDWTWHLPVLSLTSWLPLHIKPFHLWSIWQCSLWVLYGTGKEGMSQTWTPGKAERSPNEFVFCPLLWLIDQRVAVQWQRYSACRSPLLPAFAFKISVAWQNTPNASFSLLQSL